LLLLLLLSILCGISQGTTPVPIQCARQADSGLTDNELPTTLYKNPSACTDNSYPICSSVTFTCVQCLTDCDCPIGNYCGTVVTENYGQCISYSSKVGSHCVGLDNLGTVGNALFDGTVDQNDLYSLQQGSEFCGEIVTLPSGSLEVAWIGYCDNGVCKACDSRVAVAGPLVFSDTPGCSTLGSYGIGIGGCDNSSPQSPLGVGAGLNGQDPSIHSFQDDYLFQEYCSVNLGQSSHLGPSRYCKNFGWATF